MYYLLWLLIFPFNLALVLFCWLTNPIVCLFPSRQSNGRDKLWGIFNLWSTHDNYVDEFWYGNYMGVEMRPYMQYDYEHSALTRYWYRLRWLKRNTAYGWSYLLFSIPKGKGFQWKGISRTYFGYRNDYNIGFKNHNGFDRDDYACRIIGLRKS